MRRLYLVVPAFCAALAVTPAGAADLTIGFAAPVSGPSALLGQQMRQGAEAAASAVGATLVMADDGCTAAGGEEAARQFATARVALVAGFLCTDAIEAALPILKDAGIATLGVGVRSDGLTDRRDKTGWLLFRIAPRTDGEASATSEILTFLWRDALFAIVDDGTIYGRELAETLRAAAEAEGLKPVFVDTYRPGAENQIALAGRLRKAGATHVFVGGDRQDIAVLGRDAASLGFALTIAGGESLRAASEGIELQTGTLMIGLAEPADEADPAVLEKLRGEGIEPEGYVLPAYAAIEIAAEAIKTAGSEGRKPEQTLADRSFVTAIGSIRFDEKGDLAENPFRLFRLDGQRFVAFQ